MFTEFTFIQALYIQISFIIAFFYIQISFCEKNILTRYFNLNNKIINFSGRVTGVWLLIITAIYDDDFSTWLDIVLLGLPFFILILPFLMREGS
ncbi:hypothetical protein CXF72_05110 [Psychromonas sp. MB-3u-54]|nr:hypothetical protein CXF72_05110 [Psychromonas sp. MB-3u-54]